MKIKLICDMKAVSKIYYIKFTLKRIELAKKLFVGEIEQGMETLIPQELSQNNFSLVIKFYDPIL